MGQIGKFFVAIMSIAVAGVSQASEVAGAADHGAYVEEIVVTAQKREQVLQEVPISMSVLDTESLQLRGFSRLEDISFAVPNLAITSPSGARSVQFTMRGITGQTFFPAAESYQAFAFVRTFPSSLLSVTRLPMPIMRASV